MMNREESDGGGAKGHASPRLVIGVVIAVLALVFVFQNTGSGTVNILFWDLRLPAWLWMLLLFLAGVVVGSLFPWFRRKRKAA